MFMIRFLKMIYSLLFKSGQQDNRDSQSFPVFDIKADTLRSPHDNRDLLSGNRKKMVNGIRLSILFGIIFFWGMAGVAFSQEDLTRQPFKILRKITRKKIRVFESSRMGMIVNGEKQIVRKKPDKRTAIIGTIEPGKIFYIVDDSDSVNYTSISSKYRIDGVRIVVDGRKTGWISKSNLKIYDISDVTGLVLEDTPILSRWRKGKRVGKLKKDDMCRLDRIRFEFWPKKTRKYCHIEKKSLSGWVQKPKLELSFDRIIYFASLNCLDLDDPENMNPDLAEKLLRYLLMHHSNIKVDAMNPKGKSYQIDMGASVLYHLSTIAIHKKAYHVAITYLDQIISRFPDEHLKNGSAGGLALIQKSMIYSDHFKRNDQAIPILKMIIKNYPGEPFVETSEHATIDLKALTMLRSIIVDSGLGYSERINHYNEIFRISQCPAIKLMALIESAMIQRENTQYESAVTLLFDGIKQFPDAEILKGETSFNYSISALELMINILIEDLSNSGLAIERCQWLFQKYRSLPIGRSSLFMRAEIFDRTQGKRGAVIENYELFIRNFPGWTGPRTLFRKTCYPFEEMSTKVLHKRLISIKSFNPKVIPVKGDVTVYRYPGKKRSVVSTLEKGEKINVLYHSKHDNDEWIKVQLNDNRIGWIKTEIRSSSAALDGHKQIY